MTKTPSVVMTPGIANGRPIGAWSLPVTTQRVLELLSDLNWKQARVVDVGAGRGHFSHRLGEILAAQGMNPGEHIFSCDLEPEVFEYEAVTCRKVPPSGELPFAADTFDAVVSIEVIEHVENQFAFMRELARVAKPGAVVIVTTPNVLNANSRIRTLLSGFPLLFDPLPFDAQNRRRLEGHIHPISPYYLALAAVRAGLERPSFHPDRTKVSGALWTLLLWPLLLVGALRQRLRLAHKRSEVWNQNRELITTLRSWKLLTCRTAVLRVYKPSSEAGR
jgi:SAM-dependent methyltransferase